MLVQIIDMLQRKAFFFFLAVKKAYRELLGIVEAKTANRLSVVIVQQNRTVTLSIAHNDAPWADHFAQNGPDNMEALNFFCCRD